MDLYLGDSIRFAILSENGRGRTVLGQCRYDRSSRVGSYCSRSEGRRGAGAE